MVIDRGEYVIGFSLKYYFFSKYMDFNVLRKNWF